MGLAEPGERLTGGARITSLASLIVALITGGVQLLVPLPSVAQPSPRRMIVATGVVCREEPNRTARAVYTYSPGEAFSAQREMKQADAVWYFDGTRTFSGCWVFGPMTVAYDYDSHREMLLAVVGHILQPRDDVAFLDYVEVENLLLGTDKADTMRSNADALRSSGLLQFRLLQLVGRAAAQAHDEGLTLEQNPLVKSWGLSHRDTLGDDPFSAAWYPLSAPYWKLYDRFHKEPWADELAWTAAQLRRPTDECYSHCVLQASIIEGPVQYWSRRPSGAHVVDAIDLAIAHAKYAASMACYDGRKGSASDSPVPANMVNSIRESLRAVNAAGKQQLLAYLDEAVKKCQK